MSTRTERLLAQMRAQGLDVPEGATIERTYAGRVQRASGAWSWWLQGPGGQDLNTGSQYPVGLLVRGWHADKDARSGDTHLYPSQVVS